MFDLKATFVIPIPTPEGIKKIDVRFPTDSEYANWRRLKKVIQKDLGRGDLELQPTMPEAADLKLVKAILVNKEDLSKDEMEAKAEASYILTRLFESEVTARPGREGSQYVIPVRIMRKAMVKHALRAPYVSEQMEYDRSRSGVILGKYGQQEIRINAPASGTLYDKLKVQADGYVGEVPLVHKEAVINVLLQELREQESPAPVEEDEDSDRD